MASRPILEHNASVGPYRSILKIRALCPANDHASATGLEDVLRQHKANDLYIMGLAADYCIKYTALDARRLDFNVNLIEEGVRGVELNKGDCEKAIQEMQDAGVKMIGRDDI